eukprot:GCRY01005370.1.p1 GENE.GCRY01005370.1~~GCRY01005370.1.p1  ORF type:complete len:237 (+),score=78.93 GCRY01005370.1:716-1426(+)
MVDLDCAALKRALKTAEAEATAADSTVQVLQEEVNRLGLVVDALSTAKEENEAQLLSQSEELQLKTTENSTLREKLAQTEAKLGVIAQQVNEQEALTARMAAKLLEYKAKINTLSLQLRKWRVTKVNRFMPNVDAVMLLTKDPASGLLFFHVNSGVGDHMRQLDEIADVQTGPDNSPRFAVLYTDEKIEVFDAGSVLKRNEIVDNLQEFMRMCKELPVISSLVKSADDLARLFGEM